MIVAAILNLQDFPPPHMSPLPPKPTDSYRRVSIPARQSPGTSYFCLPITSSAITIACSVAASSRMDWSVLVYW